MNKTVKQTLALAVIVFMILLPVVLCIKTMVIPQLGTNAQGIQFLVSFGLVSGYLILFFGALILLVNSFNSLTNGKKEN
ncbi:MAG: hypothetical protein M0R31_07485 [Candidatus Riflebacteria bacterium]|nr:hypothetical protein [Candidatus Riflebacteria bacterium]